MRGGEYKCRVFKIQLKLRDQQLKAMTYMYALLHPNLMETTNQKSIINILTKKKKESKHNTEDGHQIKGEEKKQRKQKKRAIF